MIRRLVYSFALFAILSKTCVFSQVDTPDQLVAHSVEVKSAIIEGDFSKASELLNDKSDGDQRVSVFNMAFLPVYKLYIEFDVETSEQHYGLLADKHPTLEGFQKYSEIYGETLSLFRDSEDSEENRAMARGSLGDSKGLYAALDYFIDLSLELAVSLETEEHNIAVPVGDEESSKNWYWLLLSLISVCLTAVFLWRKKV